MNTAPNDYPATPDPRVLATIAAIAAHHNKTWCFPSQATLLQKLNQHHARKMSRRTLNRHLGALVRDGMIDRIRRHKKGPEGQLVLHSTIYTIKAYALRALAKFAAILKTAAAHAWSSRWISAVPQVAQSNDQQLNINGNLPKKQAGIP